MLDSKIFLGHYIPFLINGIQAQAFLSRIDCQLDVAGVPLDRFCKFLPIAFLNDFDTYVYHDLRVNPSPQSIHHSLALIEAGSNWIYMPHRRSKSTLNELISCISSHRVSLPRALGMLWRISRSCLSFTKYEDYLSLPVSENGFFVRSNSESIWKASLSVIALLHFFSIGRDQLCTPLIFLDPNIRPAGFPFPYNHQRGCKLHQRIHNLSRFNVFVLNSKTGIIFMISYVIVWVAVFVFRTFRAVSNPPTTLQL